MTATIARELPDLIMGAPRTTAVEIIIRETGHYYPAGRDYEGEHHLNRPAATGLGATHEQP